MASLSTAAAGNEKQSLAYTFKEKKDFLIEAVWKEQGFPRYRQVDKIIKNCPVPPSYSTPNIKRVDQLLVRMAYGVDSKIYLFHPVKPNRDLLIYHFGHQKKENENKIIVDFINDGFTLLLVSMPLTEENSRPVVTLPDGTKKKLETHNDFQLIETDVFSPLQFFLEPVAAGLNHCLSESEYETIVMMGLSGGGWTTILYAAADNRIQKSFPVAGSLPLALRNETPSDTGDYEQRIPSLYEKVSYVDLYVLGAYGPGRRQHQVINRYDPCCFGGLRYKNYLGLVQEKLKQLGSGQFDVYLDESHRSHTISEKAVSLIRSALKGGAKN